MPSQPSQFFTGASALHEFQLALARAFDEDALGGVVGYDWCNGHMATERITEADDPRLVKSEDNAYTFPLVIIDSGNSAGDVWKFVYHPLTNTGMFCYEA